MVYVLTSTDLDFGQFGSSRQKEMMIRKLLSGSYQLGPPKHLHRIFLMTTDIKLDYEITKQFDFKIILTDTDNNITLSVDKVGYVENVNEKPVVKKLSENAIIENNDETVILVLKSFNEDLYSFETKNVTIGKKQNGFVEITSKNIKPTDKILTNGAYGLIMN